MERPANRFPSVSWSARPITTERTAEVASTPERSTSRSEEHTSELQSPCNLVCRLLLDKKNRGRAPGRQQILDAVATMAAAPRGGAASHLVTAAHQARLFPRRRTSPRRRPSRSILGTRH